MDEDTDYEGLSSEMSRPPSVEDLVRLCSELNSRGARYLVVGGFAIRGAGYIRETMDVDLLIDTSLENEALVYQALEILPDQAVKELLPGEVSQYNVVRVGDEIVVDLMASACGIDYDEAIQDSIIRVVDGSADPLCLAAPALAHEGKNLPRKGCAGPAFPPAAVWRRDFWNEVLTVGRCQADPPPVSSSHTTPAASVPPPTRSRGRWRG
jgi:hypothetical protein